MACPVSRAPTGGPRIVDEAVLRTVMATLFTDNVVADLTADVTKRLAWIARQPIPSTKKLEREIANEDRQLMGDVIITTQQVEGQEKPQMVARFTINAVPALAMLDRGRAAAHDDSDVSIWESLPDDRETPSDRSLNQGEVSVPLLRTLPRKR